MIEDILVAVFLIALPVIGASLGLVHLWSNISARRALKRHQKQQSQLKRVKWDGTLDDYFR